MPSLYNGRGWRLEQGTIVILSSASNPALDGMTFNVARSGQVMTHASANDSDGTDVPIVLTQVH